MRRFSTVLLVVLALIPAAAFAATTPSSATLSPSNPSVNYTGGPFQVSNPSSPLGENPPVCTTDICSEFKLTISIPATDTKSYRARVSVTWQNHGTTTQGSSTSDYDLYIYQPDVTGTKVGQGPGTVNPEIASFPATNGSYTIYVVPYDVSPSVPFSASVTLEENASGGGFAWGPNLGNTAVPPGTPRFFNYHAPPGVAEDAGEPLIGVNRKTEKVFGGIPNGGTVNYFGGFLPYMLSVTFDDRTAPATTTWKQVPLVMATLPRVYGDPYLFTDRDTGRTFVTQELGLTPLGSTMEFTDNDDAPFTPSMGSGAPSGIDHETIGGGPFHEPIPSGVNPDYPNGVWYCSQAIAYAVCALSLDGGITFGPSVPMYTLAQCGGLHGHIKIARDGTAYVPNRGCTFDDGEHQGLVVSEDNGITWSVRSVTTSTPGDRDPSVAVADDGTVYFAYQASDGKSRVAVSHDKGLTWEKDTDLGAALGIQNSVFHTAVAGDGPRAAVAFFGTTTAGSDYNVPDFRGTWYLFVSTTFDGGTTWVTQNASPGDPIQRGGICNDGACRNLLDFFGITVDKQGRIVVGYDDGCISSNCISGTRAYGFTAANDFTAKAAIARQASGKRLYAEFDSQAGPDITPPLPPPPPPAATSCDGNVVTDPGGDATHPLFASTAGPYDQVDITAVNFAVDDAKTTLTTTLTIKNFTPQPVAGSLGTFYYTTWTNATRNADGSLTTRAYATRAEVQATGAVVYRFGQYDQAADAFLGTSTVVTGSFTTGPNGTLKVNVPLALLGNPTIPVTNATALPAVIEPYAVTIIHEQAVRFIMPADRAPNVGNFGASWAVCLPPRIVCIDEDDPSIGYSDNWHDLGQTRMHAGSAKKDSVRLTVNVADGATGKITYNYATSPKGGSAEIFIDGVSRGIITYAGTQGSTRNPALGASVSYSGLAPGAHIFEIRNMSGNVYVDGFCFEDATSTGTPATGPAATTNSSSVNVPAEAYSVSLVSESSLPVTLALVDPSGLTLGTANSASGVAVLTVPVNSAGTYLVKVINLNLGPVEVWTAATPNVRR
ncbi:MAG TPA: sialidase family protein [Thermoanaerobaculia bacterium]